jgi:hypothetical protein
LEKVRSLEQEQVFRFPDQLHYTLARAPKQGASARVQLRAQEEQSIAFVIKQKMVAIERWKKIQMQPRFLFHSKLGFQNPSCNKT